MFDYLIEHNRYISIIGICTFLFIAFLFSTHKRRISVRLLFSALAMQFLLAFFILKTDVGLAIFTQISYGFQAVYGFANSGTEFVFGRLANTQGPWGMIFAIKALPVIIFFGALMALLYHIGIVQLFVKGLALIIRPVLGTSGAETLSVAANSMLGQTEAPLLIKNYLARMTNSEMMTVMTSGMAHLSGSILAVYGMMGVPLIHLISSSVIAIPGAILISKMLIPETEVPETLGSNQVAMKPETKNALDAIASGTSDGLRLAVNVAAMLIVFISLIALINYLLASATGLFLPEPVTLNILFGKLFYGVAWLIGIPLQDCSSAGTLLGEKLVINEFVAYSDFVKLDLLDRTRSILTYALAGFSNFACIGIQLGGIGALCPEKRLTITQIGFRALLGGTLTNLLTAAIAGLFI